MTKTKITTYLILLAVAFIAYLVIFSIPAKEDNQLTITMNGYDSIGNLIFTTDVSQSAFSIGRGTLPSQISFTISVTNTGNVDINNVQLYISSVPHVENSFTACTSVTDSGDSVKRCDLGQLSVGGTLVKSSDIMSTALLPSTINIFAKATGDYTSGSGTLPLCVVGNFEAS